MSFLFRWIHRVVGDFSPCLKGLGKSTKDVLLELSCFLGMLDQLCCIKQHACWVNHNMLVKSPYNVGKIAICCKYPLCWSNSSCWVNHHSCWTITKSCRWSQPFWWRACWIPMFHFIPISTIKHHHYPSLSIYHHYPSLTCSITKPKFAMAPFSSRAPITSMQYFTLEQLEDLGGEPLEMIFDE